jgi:hypothetical protein
LASDYRPTSPQSLVRSWHLSRWVRRWTILLLLGEPASRCDQRWSRPGRFQLADQTVLIGGTHPAVITSLPVLMTDDLAAALIATATNPNDAERHGGCSKRVGWGLGPLIRLPEPFRHPFGGSIDPRSNRLTARQVLRLYQSAVSGVCGRRRMLLRGNIA